MNGAFIIDTFSPFTLYLEFITMLYNRKQYRYLRYPKSLSSNSTNATLWHSQVKNRNNNIKAVQSKKHAEKNEVTFTLKLGCPSTVRPLPSRRCCVRKPRAQVLRRGYYEEGCLNLCRGPGKEHEQFLPVPHSA